MSTLKTDAGLNSLDLPREFEDLEGLLQTDLKAVTHILSRRANDRLLLSRREYRDLQIRLWNRLTEAVNESLAPLSAEQR